MEFRALLLIVTQMLFLMGCVNSTPTRIIYTPPPYTPPQSGPMAEVKVFSNLSAHASLTVSFYDPKACESYTLAGFHNSNFYKTKIVEISTAVSTSEPTQLVFRFSVPSRGKTTFCSINRAYNLEDGGAYEFQFVEQRRACNIIATNVNDPNQILGPRVVEFEVDEEWCKTINKKAANASN